MKFQSSSYYVWLVNWVVKFRMMWYLQFKQKLLDIKKNFIYYCIKNYNIFTCIFNFKFRKCFSSTFKNSVHFWYMLNISESILNRMSTYIECNILNKWMCNLSCYELISWISRGLNCFAVFIFNIVVHL